ncbi:acyl dehydratase [Streptomyces sp. NPDC058321]|uniref:acyl dehydratase n=1 Tax=Streptomyces sp. NPDC058321 TaxID=3346445 RepID=UPI0036F01B7A
MTTATHATEQLHAEDIAVGHELTPHQQLPTTVQLFRYCAMTWNSHRIHFDKDYAASEGYPDVLVQSHLHGAFLTTLCTRFAGEQGRLERLSYAVRRFAIPGDTLTLSGTVTNATESDGGTTFRVDIREVREADGTVCAHGDADIYLPSRGCASQPRRVEPHE